jgi:hypothetical protein
MSVRRIAAIGLLSFLACQAQAAAYGSGKITQVGGQSLGANIIYFALTPTPTNRASCNTHVSYQFMLDVSTADGKALYSTLLMAVASGTNVTVLGTGTCGGPSIPLETVSWWYLSPT